MNNDEFVKVIIVMEGVTKALLLIHEELKIMNEQGVVVFAGENSLEN